MSCRQIAARTAVDAVRLYLRDGDFLDRPMVVLRERSDAAAAPPPGEPLVDLAAATGRIIESPDDGSRPWPVAMAAPLIGERTLLGVLALRRGAERFRADDVERARQLARLATRTIEMELVHAAAPARIGVPIVRGRVEGPITAFPHGLVASRLRGRGNLFPGALDDLGRALDDVRMRLRENVCLSMRPALAALRAVVRISPLANLRNVDADVLARALCGADDDTRDLALLAAARAARVRFPEPGGVLVTRRWSSVLALAAIGGGVAACVGAAPLDPVGLTATILHAAHLPSVAAVEGIADAARAGSIARVVDGAIDL